jgi:hypothetical protein
MDPVLEIAPEAFVPWTGQPIEGRRYPLTIVGKSSAQQLAALGLYVPEPATSPPPGKRVVPGSVSTIARADGVVRYVDELEDIPLADRKAERLAELAARRWEIETGGIVVGELTVPSDRETQDRIDQIVGAYSDDDISGPVSFKLAPGVHQDIDDAVLRAVKAVGAQHIQQCFRREGELAVLILAAADLAALDAIDVQGFWA